MVSKSDIAEELKNIMSELKVEFVNEIEQTVNMNKKKNYKMKSNTKSRNPEIREKIAKEKKKLQKIGDQLTTAARDTK